MTALSLMVVSFGIFTYAIYRKQASSFLVVILVFICGIFAYSFKTVDPSKYNVIHFAKDNYLTCIGIVDDDPRVMEDRAIFVVRIEKLIYQRRELASSGKINVFLWGKADDLGYGCRVRIEGILSRIGSADNFGILSYSELMEEQGISAQLRGRAGDLKVLDRRSGNPVCKLIILINKRLFASLRRTMKEPYSSLLGSIILGSKASPLPEDMTENFRNAGVMHLLVVSGLQVSILLGVIVSILKTFGLSSFFRFIAASIFNFLFVIMTGAGSSIIRAAIMGETALFANIFQKENEFYNSLFLSGLVLILMSPLNLFSIGFQLSFLATWALFYIAPAIEEKLKVRMPGFIAGLLSIAVAPTLATTPVILYNFGQLSFISVVSNLAIIPWVEAVVVIGFFSILAGPIFLPIAFIINGFLSLVLQGLEIMVSFFSHLPFAYRFVRQPSLPLILGYYIILMWCVEMLKNRIKFRFDRTRIIVVLTAALIAIAWNFAASAVPGDQLIPGKQLVITVIDVGQGDSILVESSAGKTMLIDGGGRYQDDKKKIKETVGKKIIVPYLRKRGINKLDVVVLTHPHDDHVGGLVSVLEAVPVKLVIDPGKPHTSYSYIKFLKLVEKKKIPYKLGRRGMVIDLGEGVKGYLMYPTDTVMGSSDTGLNDVSIVMKLVCKDFAMLLPGDLEIRGERDLIEKKTDLRSDILKAGHHGSKTSTSRRFLDAVKPKYGVISVGAKNKFGHPSGKTLEALQNAGVKVYRTDLNGAVMIRTDGKKLTITTAKQP